MSQQLLAFKEAICLDLIHARLPQFLQLVRTVMIANDARLHERHAH